MIDEARNNDLRVHFASLMDLCHLNNAELKKHQQCKARVVLRSDIVKDDRGSYAVFTEEGSSASQMTAAQTKISFQGYPDAQDKQPMLYRLTIKYTLKVLQYC